MKGREWSVYLQSAHKLGADQERLKQHAEELVEVLAGFAAVVSYDPGVLAARLNVRAPSPEAALVTAEGILERSLQRIRFPGQAEIVAAEVQTVGELERQLRRRNFPPLVGISEIGELLAVSRQRAAEIARRPDFPTPLAKLAAGPVWNRHAVARFLERWPRRRTGRPRKMTDLRSAAKRVPSTVVSSK